MSSDFLPVAGPIVLALGSLIVGFLLGTMIGRRSMNKHLDATPMQLNELSAQLAATMETSAKWQDASQKWQSARGDIAGVAGYQLCCCAEDF